MAGTPVANVLHPLLWLPAISRQVDSLWESRTFFPSPSQEEVLQIITIEGCSFPQIPKGDGVLLTQHAVLGLSTTKAHQP
jgi:hypothetical protein